MDVQTLEISTNDLTLSEFLTFAENFLVKLFHPQIVYRSAAYIARLLPRNDSNKE